MTDPAGRPASRNVVLTLGEAIVAALPSEPVRIESSGELHLSVGGAELNFAVAIRRLGVASRFLGVVGDDPPGRLVQRALDEEDVDSSLLRVAPEPTALYLREWLSDGERRPYYYRRSSAGSTLSPSDCPEDLADCSWLHVSGITPALSSSCAEAVEAMLTLAKDRAIPVSFDPNYRAALWDVRTARAALEPMVSRCAVLLVGLEEIDFLLGTSDPVAALDRASALGVATTVVKLGADGSIGRSASGEVVHCPPVSARALDPVGAGDAFDAGFVAARLAGASLLGSLGLASFCGARVVERVGEHDGAPHRDELPPELRMLLDEPSLRDRYDKTS
ncbi:MAG: PfkB domain protein [Acidimicrobiaceae bacterium]|nr:PfkB domain protein [Acidimicrobiaceae bacterium]